MKLTEHFSVEEFERSGYARDNRIDNSVPRALLPSLCNLCAQVLEPLRKHAGKPIIISSGYRCPDVNTGIGSKPSSQHIRGEAADIHLYSVKEGKEWFTWMVAHCSFDQLIWETGVNGAHWIHVSCKIDLSANRKKVGM